MIAWLEGTIRDIDPAGLVVVDVGGVGYAVHVSMQTLGRQKKASKANFHIHTHVREDQITLFGFDSPHERSLFCKLMSVSGIGARTALNILSAMSVDALLTAVDASDDVAIARTPGIGKKTAQRLILELKGKLITNTEETANQIPSLHADVRSAMINLGYKQATVDIAIKKAGEHTDFESLFKAALKALT